MTKEQLKEFIKEYLKENLIVEIDEYRNWCQPDTSGFKIKITTKIEDEVISETWASIDFPQQERF